MRAMLGGHRGYGLSYAAFLSPSSDRTIVSVSR
jgi:hypothetical protein